MLVFNGKSANFNWQGTETDITVIGKIDFLSLSAVFTLFVDIADFEAFLYQTFFYKTVTKSDYSGVPNKRGALITVQVGGFSEINKRVGYGNTGC